MDKAGICRTAAFSPVSLRSWDPTLQRLFLYIAILLINAEIPTTDHCVHPGTFYEHRVVLFSWLPASKLRLKLGFTVTLAFQYILSFFSFIPFIFSSCFQSLPPDLEAMSSLQIGAGKANLLQGEVQEREEPSFRHELRQTEGSHIKETLQDQISQCFIECRWAERNTYPLKSPFAPKSLLLSSYKLQNPSLRQWCQSQRRS